TRSPLLLKSVMFSSLGCSVRSSPVTSTNAVRQNFLSPRDQILETLGDTLVELRLLIVGKHVARLLAAARVVVLRAFGLPLFVGVEVHDGGHEEGGLEMFECVLGAEEMSLRSDL